MKELNCIAKQEKCKNCPLWIAYQQSLAVHAQIEEVMNDLIRSQLIKLNKYNLN